jgi:hypothetical protein
MSVEVVWTHTYDLQATWLSRATLHCHMTVTCRCGLDMARVSLVWPW